MWQTKIFKTQKQLDKWIKRNSHKVQYEIIYVNNGYGVEYRKLRTIERKGDNLTMKVLVFGTHIIDYEGEEQYRPVVMELDPVDTLQKRYQDHFEIDHNYGHIMVDRYITPKGEIFENMEDEEHAHFVKINPEHI